MTLEPDSAVVAYLQLSLGPSWVLGTNILTGPVQAPGGLVTAEAIFCLSSGGPPPAPLFGSATSGGLRRSMVEVRIRSAGSAYGSGLAIARDVQAALERASVPGYIACAVQQSEPIYLQADSADRHEFLVGVRLSRLS